MTREQRFWRKVEKTEKCWLWTAATNAGGYGVFNDKEGGGKPMRLAHVVSLELAGIAVPPGHECDHTCTTPACVNPAHLVVTTRPKHLQRHRLTACRKGHPFTEANTHIRPNGKRVCRTCDRERKKDARK